MISIPSEVATALDMLTGSGFEAFIVGGCVRDSLLGKAPKDYDITTSALPSEVEEVFKNYRIIETGIKHGTVTVLIDGTPLEITTYRIDSDYTDNRHPNSVDFTKSLYEDTARRDFTMNAIAYNDKSGLVDYYGGENDILKGIIRCVGNADRRFKEDALRILRAIRFSSVLGFNIEDSTKQAIFRNKELLTKISQERIASELVKLLCGKNVRKVLVEYIDVLGVVIPELLPMKDFDQHNYHHIYDVLTHTAVSVENIEPQSVLRLAALFHDIGKPHCFTLVDGTGHFYGHASISAEIADRILERLKFDNATRKTVGKLIRLHDVQIECRENVVKRSLNKNSPEIFFMLLKLKKADTLALNPKYCDRLELFDELESLAYEILEKNACFSLKDLSVNGSDIMSLGVSPGKKIGIILNLLLEDVINGKIPNERDCLLDKAKKMI